ncbi:MAG TPA: OmpH family outer membrane protein [Methylomirabilota bacterium]|nr:OmpH family outer membrane protein [Methylomirabilota bacterium]
MLKRALIGSSVAALFLGWAAGAPAQAAGTKIGFVDVQKVLVKSVAGIGAREQLEKERGSMQKDLESRRNELEKLRDDLQKKGALLSADARREKEETVERKNREARRLMEDFQKDLEKKELGVTQKILQEIQGIVERFGKQKGYLFITEKRTSGLIYGDPESDVTDEIIRLYDQEHAKLKK